DGVSARFFYFRSGIRLYRADVLRCRALRTLDDLELDRLTLAQRLESLPTDGGMVDEDVLGAVVRGDESEALRVVEPLHLSLRHGTDSFRKKTPVQNCPLSLNCPGRTTHPAGHPCRTLRTRRR